MPSWRFATWNLDFRMRNPRRTSPWQLIRRARADVFALQEVQGREIRVLRNEHDGEAVFSQELYERANLRWMGCGLLLAPGGEVLNAGVFLTLPKPQRGLWARVRLPGIGEMTAVSWHSPNAAGDTRPVKIAVYAGMTEWLARAERPIVLGADLNTWHDPVELVAASEDDDYYEEMEFVGINPRHKLADAYRGVLERRGQLEALRTTAPPLATSHVLQGGAAHRMDRIYASSEFTPVDGEYWYDEAIDAGSDHALHWIEFAS